MQKIKRNITFVFILIMIIALSSTKVYATASCNGLLTPGAANLIKDIIGYIQMSVPVLLIFWGAYDFAGAVMSDDKESLKKATTRFMKRCAAAAAVFFLPLLIQVVLGLPGIKDSVNLVDDPLCGVTTK